MGRLLDDEGYGTERVPVNPWLEPAKLPAEQRHPSRKAG